MQFPTLQQIASWVANQDPLIAEKFEYAHKLQLFYLWQAGNLCQNIPAQLNQQGKPVTKIQIDTYQSYLLLVKNLWVSWLSIQQQIDNASNTQDKLNLTGGDIFTASGLLKIKNILKKWNPNDSLAWVPLVVGAGTALLAIWGIYQISIRFTTTVEDKIELLKATEETVKNLGLTPEQASKIITDTQEQAHEGTGLMDTLKYGILAFMALQVFKSFNKN